MTASSWPRWMRSPWGSLVASKAPQNAHRTGTVEDREVGCDMQARMTTGTVAVVAGASLFDRLFRRRECSGKHSNGSSRSPCCRRCVASSGDGCRLYPDAARLTRRSNTLRRSASNPDIQRRHKRGHRRLELPPVLRSAPGGREPERPSRCADQRPRR